MNKEQPATAYKEWAHAPSHLFQPGAIYMITAATYKKALLFDTPQKRDFLLSALFEESERLEWRMQAWAVMANHYHFVALAPSDADSLKTLTRRLHSRTARWVNGETGHRGRKVWHQYWDTCLTFEKSYLARLNYVHMNPVKHGIVSKATAYPWCSMAWFLRGARAGFRKTVLSFDYKRVSTQDDF